MLQDGNLSWDHLIYQALLVVMVIVGYHIYYRNQWEAQMTAVVTKVMHEVERSSRQLNHGVKNKGYHDDTAEYCTRDTIVSPCNHGNSCIV